MKTVTIILPDSHDRLLSSTAVGLHGVDCNVATQVVDLDKGTVIRYDGKQLAQEELSTVPALLEIKAHGKKH